MIDLNPGQCIVKKSTKDNMHEFGLFDIEGNQIHTGYFENLEQARMQAKEEFSDKDYYIKDLTEEWLVRLAKQYKKCIKKLQPSFRTSQLVLDMSRLYYSRTPNDWYTYIPFTYKGKSWCYRATGGEEWVHKSYLKEVPPSADAFLNSEEKSNGDKHIQGRAIERGR